MVSPLVITGGNVWTGWTECPVAGSVTVRGDRISALDEPTRAGGAGAGGPRGPGEPGDSVIDVGGGTVIPGLIDAHVHLLLGGRSLRRLDLAGVRDRAGFEAAVGRRHAELPGGEWLIAGGWSQEHWPGHRMPDKSWLAATGDRPVVCYRQDLHAALVNDAVLRLCGVDPRAPGSADELPEGGRIERDAQSGEATGLMLESAAWRLVNPLIPDLGPGERRAAFEAAQSHLLERGLTAVGSMEYRRDVEAVYGPARDRDALDVRMRITILDRAWPMEFDFGATFAGDEWLDVIGYKAFVDGTLGSRTAFMLDDYDDAPGNRGMLLEIAAEGHLEAWARGVCASGLSPSIHAIGDGAARMALDAVEAAVRVTPGAPPPRIEHAQQIDLADVGRFRGVIASMQPLHRAEDGPYAPRRVGETRLAGSFAFRRLLDAGATLAFGSDWPVVSCDPMAGIRAAVTGLTVEGAVFGADQNLSVEEALRAYTSGAARALGMKDAGVIRPGGLADFVVLDRDPLTADWIADPPQVRMTIVGGRVRYDSGRISGCGQRSSPSVTS